MTEATNIAGLTLARKLLNDDRAAFVQCHIVPEAGLSAGDRAIADDYTAAIAAITGAAAELRTEHAQRVTAERDELVRQNAELAARLAEIERAEPVAWMHADGRMASGWAPRSARAENFVGWSPLIYIPGVAPQPPAAEPVLEIRLGRYRHYKGGEYRVLGVVRHSEYLEPMVLYRSLGSDGGDWVRPFGMFFETVEHEGKSVPRFELLDDGPARPCRTCGPEGCSDSTACPRDGGAA